MYTFDEMFFKKFFKKHIGGEAADFRPKVGSYAFSCNHPRPNMADQNCNLGNDPYHPNHCRLRVLNQ